MAEDKNGFILYADQRELVDSMSNEQAGELFKTIMSYVNDEDPTPREDIKFAFMAFKARLKFDLKKWDSIRQKRSEAGKKGNEKRWGKSQE